MKKTLTYILLLLATGTAFSQVPLLKKPVLAPQLKPAIKRIVSIDRSAILKPVPTPTAPPNRTETARRLKAQNVPVEAALVTLRETFGSDMREEATALYNADYPNEKVFVVMKQAYDLQPIALQTLMIEIGFGETWSARQLRIIYAMDFDQLLATLRQSRANAPRSEFGDALAAMDYTAEQMVQVGYRYFIGGFPDLTSAGTPFPSAKRMYGLLMHQNPLREKVEVDHYSLFQLLMAAGYSPQHVIAEVSMGKNSEVGREPMDDVAECIRQNTSDGNIATGRNPDYINPKLAIQMAPDGTASHPEGRRSCIVQFLGLLRANGTRRDVASVLADLSVSCFPATNMACPAQRAAVVASILNEAGFGS